MDDSYLVFEGDMPHEEKMKHKRECLDKQCLDAMEAMNVCLETIKAALADRSPTIEQIIGLTEQAAKLSDAMARLKTCMNYPAWAAV